MLFAENDSEKLKQQIKNEKKVKNDEENGKKIFDKETVPDFNNADNITDSIDQSSQHCDDRGKAGNLWSAQIVENRCPESTDEVINNFYFL